MNQTEEAAKPVAGYFRVSKARDGMSAPDIYEREIVRYCDYKGLTLGRLYSDIDYSGWRNSRTRPALRELVAERASFSTVVVPKLSRFGRDLGHLSELFELFDREGIALIFLDLGLDTSSSQGRLLRNIMASIAEYESDVKSDYSRASHRHVARQGRPWGSAPYGYRYDPATKNFHIQEPQATVVRELFTRFAAGDAMNALTRDLRGRDVPSARGATWKVDAVRRMLDNPTYVGLRRSDGQLIEATWEPIIDRAMWDTVATRRAKQRRRGSPRPANQRPEYLLTGLMVCGVCGRNLVHRPQRQTRAGLHACPDSGHFSRPCTGGGIGTHRAEEMVVRAFRNRFWFAFGDDERLRHERLTALESRWGNASIAERREMLSLTISRIELVPRPSEQPRGKGAKRGREIRIVWADSWQDLDPNVEKARVTARHDDGMKYCRGCGLDKPLAEFESDVSRWDGRTSRCKTCRRQLRSRRAEATEDRASVPAPRISYQEEWRRFLDASRDGDRNLTVS